MTQSRPIEANSLQIRVLVLDVDGVLTDGRLWYGETGEPLRAFCIHDGLAIRAFQRAGGTVGIITGKQSQAVARRAQELGIQAMIQGSHDKGADLRRMAADCGAELEAIAAMGDDLQDLPMLRACGYALAPANAVAEVREAARFVTSRSGGDGAVREAIEHLLGREGLWIEAVRHYERGQGEARRH